MARQRKKRAKKQFVVASVNNKVEKVSVHTLDSLVRMLKKLAK